MRVVHDIFHAMSESKEGRLSWSIHIATEMHGKVLKIMVCLESDVNEATKSVIDRNSMWVFNLFQLFSNNRCSHK